MDKRGKKRVHEKTLFPTSFLPKTVEKATRKTLIRTKGLKLKGVPGDQGAQVLLRYYVLQESVFWVWFLHRFLHVSG